MQYYQILFYLEEDNIMKSLLGRRDIRKDMGFAKDDRWPFLVVDSSTDDLDTATVQGKDAIVEYFRQHKLMGDDRAHSAYEKQGLQWVQESAIPAYELIKYTFKGRLQF